MTQPTARPRVRYRLYIDESGDHTYKLLDDTSHLYLALLGVWFRQVDDYTAFADDLERFGALLSASHDSLRDDYEVSGPELDLLVEIARGTEGVLGSRLTGAGFGGCTVSLVRPDAVEALREAVLARYEKESGCEPRIWVSEAADGAAVEA